MEAQWPTLRQGGDPFLGGMQRQAQFESAEQNNYLNQIIAKQKYEQEQQMHPVTLADTQSQTKARNAGIPSITADSILKANQAHVSTQTLDAQVDARHKKIASEISDDKLKVAENHIHQQLATLPIGSPEHTQAVKRWENLGKIREEKQKLDNAKAVAKIHEVGATERNQANIDAGRWSKKDKMSFELKLQTEGDPVKKLQLLNTGLHMAIQAGDVESAQLYSRMLNDPQLVNAAALNNRTPNVEGKPGTVNVPATTKGKVPANQPLPMGSNAVIPTTGVPTATPAPTAKPQFSGKRVTVIKDGKSFSLPEEQIEAAKAQGYTIK
jgi:hypothetical protein